MQGLKELLRRFKPLYSVYNFFQKDKLEHIEEAYKKQGVQKKYYEPVKHSDFAGLEEQLPWLDVGNSRELLPENEIFQSLSEEDQQAILNWSDNGYTVLSNFLSEEQVEACNQAVDRLIQTKEADWQYGNKIMFAIRQSEVLKSVATSKRLLRILNLLLGTEVFPFQSINFITGSEQATHSDSIHMTTFPLGYLIAVWVALEDVSTKNGTLHYYPGSHKLPYIMHEDYPHGGNALFLGKNYYKKYEEKVAEVVQELQLQKELFTAKKGDVFIWHANLLHGGEKIEEAGSTRRSMVLHYFAKGVICYHEVTQRPALMPE